jgi:hypothetical protein
MNQLRVTVMSRPGLASHQQSLMEHKQTPQPVENEKPCEAEPASAERKDVSPSVTNTGARTAGATVGKLGSQPGRGTGSDELGQGAIPGPRD